MLLAYQSDSQVRTAFKDKPQLLYDNCSVQLYLKMTSIEQAGTFRLGSRSAKRLGYGAMKLAGPGVFGPPRDRDAAVAVLREVVASGVDHIDTSDYYGPHITNQIIREALAPYPGDLTIVTDHPRVAVAGSLEVLAADLGLGRGPHLGHEGVDVGVIVAEPHHCGFPARSASGVAGNRTRERSSIKRLRKRSGSDRTARRLVDAARGAVRRLRHPHHGRSSRDHDE